MQPPFVFSLVFFSLCLELHHVRCQKICTGDKYTIVTSNGTFLRCFNCETCHPGRGLYPRCGSRILDADKSKIDCKDCPPGTFSDELDSSPCKVCQQCADHEIASSNCTKVSDTNCSKTCKKGYFFAKVSHNCQQCSYCCFDGKDEPQPECIKQGLSATGQYCSIRLDKNCSPRPTTIGTTLGTTVTSLPSTSHKTTKLPTDVPTNLPPHYQNTSTPTLTTSTGIQYRSEIR